MCGFFLQRGQCNGEFVHIPDSGALCWESGHCSRGWVINGYWFFLSHSTKHGSQVSSLAVDIHVYTMGYEFLCYEFE